MEEWTINGQKLEFDESTHSYFVNGERVQSVTQLLKGKFGGKYDMISPEVLKRAQERGTEIHKEIECYCNGFDLESRVVKNFKFLQKNYNFIPKESELPIILDFCGNTYAGRLDLILEMDGKLVLADIKTTSTLDKEYLGHQLNLYRIGYEQSYGKHIDGLYGIHLREDVRKFVNIPIKEEEWLQMSLGLNQLTADTE